MEEKIIALGDSIFAGYLADGKSFIYHLKKDFNIENKAVPGESTGQLKDFLLDFKDEGYSHALIHVGINDFLQLRGFVLVKKNIREIVKILKEKNIGPLIFLPMEITSLATSYGWVSGGNFDKVIGKIRDYRIFLKDLCNEENIPYIDLEAYGINKNHFIDGIHPSEDLHKVLYEKMREDFSKCLKI